MRAALVAILLCASSTWAGAQPITQPPTCEVTIARAPDDVRKVIEAWVRAEPRCTTSLDVRVIPTEGGLYLFARDANGRVHERVVPDAQSAGVLVASWIADDSVAWAPRGNAAPTPMPSPPEAGPAPQDAAPAAPEARPPGAAMPIAPPARATRAASRWLTLGATAGMSDGGGAGIRGDVDVIRRRGWTLGLGLSGSNSSLEIVGSSSFGYLETVDIRAVASLSRSYDRGPWQLRFQGGAGVVRTTADGTDFSNGRRLYATGVFPTAELSVMVGRRLFDHWAVAAGPVVTWYAQEMHTQSMEVMMRRDADLSGFIGVRRRL